MTRLSCSVFLLFCLSLLAAFQPALAQSDGSDFDPGDIPDMIADGIDDAADLGFGVFDFVFSRVRDGVSSAKRSIRAATAIIRRGSPAARRLAASYRRQQRKNRARIKRERKQMARFAKRIIRIAAAGGEVPVSLATRAANTAGKIFSTHSSIIRIEVEITVLQNSENNED